MMHWDLQMIFDDAVLPFIDECDNSWGGLTRDCSEASFDELADCAHDAVVALLPESISIYDVTFKIVASERFQNRTWDNYNIVTRAGAWKKELNARLPVLGGLSATAVQSIVARGLTASAALEEKWIAAAAAGLAVKKDVDVALLLLEGLKSLQANRVPGTQCFSDFDNTPEIFDCRIYVKNSYVRQPGSKLVLVEVDIRDVG